MQRMFTRRTFVSMTAASLAARALPAQEPAAQSPASHSQVSPQFSIMIWTLKKLGTFEENLDRVALAGYHHVELVGEFKKWSEEDYQRIMKRMETLDFLDATSGVTAGFSDPSGGDAFLAGLKDLIPAAKRLQCKQIILLSGKKIDGVRREASMRLRLRRSSELPMCWAMPGWWR